MAYWLKFAHSHVSKLQSNSSFSKPASYPFILAFSSITCILPPGARVKNLKRSWDSWHDDILARVCIVFVDFRWSKSLFQVKIEYYQFFSIRFVFHGHIFGLDQFLNGKYISAVLAGMCMQCICHALNISTFDEISTNFVFKIRKYHYGIKTLKSEKKFYHIVCSIQIEYIKFHSWQCIKLIMPSLFVNVANGESINIFCLKYDFEK